MSETIFPKTITIGDNEIYYTDSGDTKQLGVSTPIILMLSGWPVSCHVFDELTKIISNKYRCIAVDLPGWGNSTDKDKVFHGIDYNVEVVHRFVNRIIPNRVFSIFGYSTGGVIGIVYARNYPEITSLIMFSSPLDGTGHMRERFLHSPATGLLYYTVRCFPTLLSLLEITPVRRFLAKHMLYGLVYKGGFNKIPEQERPIVDVIFKNSFNLSPEAIFDIAVDIKRNNFVPLVEENKCKTLFLSASEDAAVPPKNTMEYCKRCRNARIHVFDGYDHFLILENPTLLAEVLEKFLLE